MKSFINSTSWAFIAVIVSALVSACASLATPETLEERLAYADGQFTALVNTATQLREADMLSEEQVEDLDAVITRGDRALDLAWNNLCLDRTESGEVESVLGCVERPENAVELLNTVNGLLLELRSTVQEAQ